MLKKKAQIDYKDLSKTILTLLAKSKTLSLNEINQDLYLEKKFIAKTLQLMVERKLIGLNLQNKFYIIT